ncbi:hypothetical protein K2173_007583 [Erythroxylum novogranatense]|uniref:Aminotransferase-like plant mobile domain-containing protein n=1 Tax=Erythroxylum novogranatense TaxID=1862640 RepID=A0AAV8S964_9ROSI|nr:hypothetical protein K2173_007583 [Erythroxylum novogranatense]
MDSNPGPVDASVLYDQDKHVSAAVWDGQERGALRCHEHTSKLGEWKLTAKQIELVEKAGFGYLRKIPAISLDNPLISALVERWRRETNTFHFTVGEMTVTLQDVALLLGLAIDGKPVIGITYTTCSLVCEKLLGKAPDSNYASGGMVKLSWLKEFFSQCAEDAPIEEVQRCTRAYLLYLVGSTIFSTTTGNKVPVMYLPLLENFEEAGKYAWGAAALAFLYRALGNACVKSQSTICGCLTLLQCWSYYHLNIGRPKLNRDPIHDHFPFVLRWKGKQSGPTTNRDVVFYRKALDSLKPTDVEWLPYKFMDSRVIPESIKTTLILGRSKTMLICFDKAERHLPDRCLRQYAMSQPIPEDVVRWVRKSRGVDGGVDLSGKMESELSEWLDRRLTIVECDDTADEGAYMQWYLRITRKVVGRPISLSSEFQRTISGLREIAYLADAFSTKGLDGQQFDSISKIRFIAQDCLRDQGGSPATPSQLPPTELGKRIRGKERVRRKSTGKRRKRDDVMDYQEASEDDQSQLYGVIEVDTLQLCHEDNEIDRLQLHQTDDKVEPLLLSDVAFEGNNFELENMVDKVADPHDINATDDVKGSLHCETINESNDCQPCHATGEVNVSQVSDATTKGADESQRPDSIDEGNKCEFLCATVSETRAKDKLEDAQLCTATNKVNDMKISNVRGGNDLLLPDASKEGNDSHLPDASAVASDSSVLSAKMQVSDSKVSVANEKGNGSLLPGTTKETNQPMVPEVKEEANDSQLSDASKVVKDSSILDMREEVNGSKLSAVTNRGNSSQLPDATDQANDLQLCDENKEADDLQATSETNDSNLSSRNDDTDPRAVRAAVDDVSKSSVETVENVAKHGEKTVVA